MHAKPTWPSVAFAVVATVAVAGCSDALVHSEDQSAEVETLSKLRNEHLLEQAVVSYETSGKRVRRRRTDPAALDRLGLLREFGRGGDNGAGDGPAGEPTDSSKAALIVRMNSNSSKLDADKMLRRYKLLRRYEYSGVFRGLAVEVDLVRLDSVLALMQGDPDIQSVEPDILVNLSRPVRVETGLLQRVPWGHTQTGATQSSTASGNGFGVVRNVHFFVMDTGAQLVDINVLGRMENYSGELTALDNYGHGHHVAATAVAYDDLLGIVGIAPGAKTWSIKVLDDNGETEISNVIAGLERILEIQSSHPGVPGVVNISFGADVGTTRYNALDEAIDSVVAQGIVVVVSAGNDGADAATVTPAHARGAITVGAYDQDNRFADFSNYGETVDILAPGVDVLSLGGIDLHLSVLTGVYMSGTSMAAPHVAGAALLYLSRNPDATPNEVRAALLESARPIVTGQPTGTTSRSLWVGEF